MSRVFVTVGTTEFDSLISVVCSSTVQSALTNLGFTDIVVQYGRGSITPADCIDQIECTLKFRTFRFKDSLVQEIKDANLVIGHAGAGTCLECLEAGKPLIVVLNESLHDNHQIELAEQLAKDSYLLYCKPDTLNSCLRNLSWPPDLQVYTRGNPQLFARWLDNCLNIATE